MKLTNGVFRVVEQPHRENNRDHYFDRRENENKYLGDASLTLFGSQFDVNQTSRRAARLEVSWLAVLLV
jgi:hypothetical protein